MALAVFAAYLVPPTLLFIPLYRIVVLLDLPDTILGLIVTYPSFTVPFSTWLLIGYFRNIPSSLEESALVDGATRLQVLWRIVLPVALPGVATVTIFSFTLSWAQFLFPSAFISSSMKKPLAVGVVSELIRGDIFHWGSLMAGASLGIIPVLLIYVFFSRFFIRGIMAGSLKG
jgi:multiple sugar transport system permease protein